MRLFSKLAVLMLFVALFAMPVAFGRNAAPAASKAPNAPATAADDDDNQPHMKAALDALKQAEDHLNQAKHDKGGHREAALKSTREAIRHVEMGMKAGDKDDHHDRDHDKK
jgi:hypothetical protein